MSKEDGPSRRSFNMLKGIGSVAAITAVLYLAANPTPREAWRTTLNTRVIPGLQKINPGLVRDTLADDIFTCRPDFPSAPRARITERCDLLGQIIRVPGALVHAARIIMRTGWPGTAMGVLTVIFMAPIIAGNLGNPVMWPIALVVGSVIGAVVLWVLLYVLMFVAWALAGILWGIAVLAGWLLVGEWFLRGMEIRRALAGSSHAPGAEPTRPGKAGRAGT